MNRRTRFRLALIGLATVLAGCDYSSKKPKLLPEDVYAGPLPGASSRAQAAPSVFLDPSSQGPAELDPETVKRREIILDNVINLMRTAYNKPGGRNFEIATEDLNALFKGTSPADYQLTAASRQFLTRKIRELSGQDPEEPLKALVRPTFTGRDARHIEDCMIYRAVALRVAGEGDDLTRVRRIFDWMCRNIQLVPAESLAGGKGLHQAVARPADVLMRGMATENGGWSERGWLFMALCRQINVDVGLLTFSPRQPMAFGAPANQAPPQLVTWICAAVVEGKPYLFDNRIGLEIPSPDGQGVATLQDAIAVPEVLDRLELPGQSTYGITAADLAGSPTRIGVLIDSTIGYLTPRMRLLQGQLRGENRTTLFRDPAEQAANFVGAIGPRLGSISLWNLPIQVEDLLFSNPEFVASTLSSLQFFDNKLPLLYARTDQLRGDLVEATNKYVALRFAENAVMNNTEKDPIPPEIQRALDLYATYFLAQCQFDRGLVDQAETLYRKMLDLVPEPGGGRYFFYMFRWGALTNLGRIREAKGDKVGAIAYYTQRDATAQRHGNLLRARDLLWTNPIADPIPPLPPAPPDRAPVASPVKPPAP